MMVALPFLIIVLLVFVYCVLETFFGPSTKEEPAFNIELSLNSVENYIQSQEDSLGIDALHRKEIIWYEGKQKSDIALVYVHGFVANKHEIRPVPDLVAQRLHANIFYTRLRGHGHNDQALAEARFSDWVYDVQEAIAVGRSIGKKVLLLSTSTGGTLVTHVLCNSVVTEDILGSVFVSPNYKIKDALSFALFLPFGKQLALMIKGESTGSLAGVEKKLLPHWNWEYPTQTLLPMAAAVKAVRNEREKIKNINIPALFIYSSKDDTVKYQNIIKMARRWGAETYEVTLRGSMNPHVITGNLRSPESVEEVTDLIYKTALRWR